MESHLFWLPVPRSNRNDNFIDKSFTVMADLIVKLLPDFPCIFSASGRDTPNEIVYCFLESESKRNEWLAVLRRMGVSIYDSSGNVVLPDTTVVHSRSDAASDRSTPRERSTAAAEVVMV